MQIITKPVDLISELKELESMWGIIFPGEKFFQEEAWKDPRIQAYWVYVNEKRVGFTIFQLNSTIASRYEQEILPAEVGTMYILMVGLLPEFCGKGLGSQIKRWHIEYAGSRRDVIRLVSNHRKGNTASYKYNTRAGYTQVCVLPEYYPNSSDATGPREDSVVMQFVL